MCKYLIKVIIFIIPLFHIRGMSVCVRIEVFDIQKDKNMTITITQFISDP